MLHSFFSENYWSEFHLHPGNRKSGHLSQMFHLLQATLADDFAAGGLGQTIVGEALPIAVAGRVVGTDLGNSMGEAAPGTQNQRTAAGER